MVHLTTYPENKKVQNGFLDEPIVHQTPLVFLVTSWNHDIVIDHNTTLEI